MASARRSDSPADDHGALHAELRSLRRRVAALERERDELAGRLAARASATESLLADPLTGLPNARAFDALAERELHNAGRYGGLMALLVLEVDVDTDAGEAAFGAVADALRTRARRGDVLARYGTAEFALLMAQCGASGAETALCRLFEALSQQGVRCAAGVAVFSLHATHLPGLIRAARAALADAKKDGPNAFRIAG